MPLSASADDFRTRNRVEEIKKQLLEALASRTAGLDHAWLRTLYTNYTQRFLADNENITRTAAIMIPASLAAFAILPYVRDVPELLTLAFASSALIVLWLFIAENHRAFQNKAYAWIIAIQEILGLAGIPDAKLADNRLTRLLTRKRGVQYAWWTVTVAVILGWVAMVIIRIYSGPPGLS